MPLVEREKEKKLYEMAYLLPVSLQLAEVNSYLEGLKSKLKEPDGEIVTEPTPQKRRLAYPIKKQDQAYFGFLRFKTYPEHIKTLNKHFKLDKTLLRYLFLMITPKQIVEEEKLSKQIKRETARKPKPLVKEKVIKELPKEVRSEEFEEKMKEIEKVVE